jgi:hypothetical protein
MVGALRASESIVGARGRGYDARLALSPLTFIDPPPADGSFLNFLRLYHQPTIVKIISISLPQLMEIIVLTLAFKLTDGI